MVVSFMKKLTVLSFIRTVSNRYIRPISNNHVMSVLNPQDLKQNVVMRFAKGVVKHGAKFILPVFPVQLVEPNKKKR